MDYNKIKELLERYWDGDTSILEEQVLKNYFNGNDVAKDLEQFKPLFVYFKEQKKLQSKHTFNDLEKKSTTRSLFPSWLMAAASVALIVTASLTYSTVYTTSETENPLLMADTYKDPEIAYKEAKEALMLISKGLNKGIEKTKEGVKKVK